MYEARHLNVMFYQLIKKIFLKSVFAYTEYLIFPHSKLDSVIWYKPNNGLHSLLLDALAFVELAVYTTLYPTSLGKANLDASAHAIEHVLNAPPFSM